MTAHRTWQVRAVRGERARTIAGDPLIRYQPIGESSALQPLCRPDNRLRLTRVC
jgi:hypothetical protein